MKARSMSLSRYLDKNEHQQRCIPLAVYLQSMRIYSDSKHMTPRTLASLKYLITIFRFTLKFSVTFDWQL